MQIVLDVVVAGIVAGGVAGGIVLASRSRMPRHATGAAAALPISAPPLLGEREEREQEEEAKPQVAVAPDPATRAAMRDEIDDELRARRAEIARIEERLITKEESLDVRLQDVARRETSLGDRARNLDLASEKLKQAKREHLHELERIARLSSAQARQILLRELEDELRHDSARLVRQIEEEARRDGERRARSILAACMQRLAGGHATETTVSVVNL